jgi:hypothetical protein
MVTLMPARLTACVESDRIGDLVPATKRCETRRPSDERSAKLRKERFSERPDEERPQHEFRTEQVANHSG